MDSQSRGKRGRHGRDRDRENQDVRLSKSLSYVLRHGAHKMGLNMSSDGFLSVDDLLAHPQFRCFTPEDVERVVVTNNKQRFKLGTHPDTGRMQIRANQGHSVPVADLELRAILPDAPDTPKEAVHGSYLKYWTSIRSQGLSRMSREHIHLAPGLPGDNGVISGMRQNCDLAIYIDVCKAISDGILFFWSENGVILTPGDSGGNLAPCYFTHAVQLKPTPCELPLE
ncbi:tRNA 2'-phosphotransferase 1 [Denticeps clupeoides]|uniref:2'-phosphotransferase n=1 Tax=Denticeps clupeoides TaxID=299321 RepID=A0AAY4CAG8_9TELE|nr:tRNA 2'-phosphotransferase 1 [Denticeps clupeoides]